MTNLQFQDIIELAEAIDFMFRAQLYRKYRPALKEHRGHFKEWFVQLCLYHFSLLRFPKIIVSINLKCSFVQRWKYAYQCIVEEDVRRRRSNWDWNHMKRHRNLCKTYANVSQTTVLNSDFQG